jgi:pyruvate/2-oxoglutarate dehydrogenase complex dihydrolipoamide acyltransferase (E2) component
VIHLHTAAGGLVEFCGRVGRVVQRGEVIARITPDEGPVEEVVAPFDALVGAQRLSGRRATRWARIVGLQRVVLASFDGRVRWVVEMGPVGVETTVALVVSEDGKTVRPHRAGGIGFIARAFAQPGARVAAGTPLVEIRGEEMG